MSGYDMVCCVVNHGQGSKTLKIAKMHGVKGGTICMGRGTIKNKLLDFLDLNDIRKEIVYMVTESASSLGTMEFLSKEMSFHKPNHGIAFSFSLEHFIGTSHHEGLDMNEEEAEAQTMYTAIFTIVEKGLAENVIDAAMGAGARGGTILNARGSSIHDTDKLFSMPIEPEKEMVMTLVNNEIAAKVAAAIRDNLQIDEPGNGVLFTVSVNAAFGLY